MLSLRYRSIVRLVVATGLWGSLSLSFADSQPQPDAGGKPAPELPITMNGEIRRYLHRSQSAGCLPSRRSNQEIAEGQSP